MLNQSTCGYFASLRFGDCANDPSLQEFIEPPTGPIEIDGKPALTVGAIALPRAELLFAEHAMANGSFLYPLPVHRDLPLTELQFTEQLIIGASPQASIPGNRQGPGMLDRLQLKRA